MPMAHDIGPRLFVQVIPFPIKKRWPLMERGHTQEIEGDYRSGDSWVIRFPRYRALVVGIWSKRLNDEDDALASALRSRPMRLTDFEEAAHALGS